jgi:hypothetical protein
VTAEIRQFPVLKAEPLTDQQVCLAEILIEHLADVRIGRYRSLIVIGVEADQHSTITTQWSLAPGDKNTVLLGAMDTIKSDLLEAGRSQEGDDD